MTISREQAFYNACCRNPLFWRKTLTLDGELWGDKLCQVQLDDFDAMDPALMYLSGHSKVKAPITRFYLQRSRGYSKTMDIGSSILWLFAFGTRLLKGLITAEDKEQAAFIKDAIAQLLQENPYLAKMVELQKGTLINNKTGAFIQVVSSDVSSSYGYTPDIVICDEFTHWSKQDFWKSVVSSYGKRADKGAVLIIGCNAGEGSDWKWEVREACRVSKLWYWNAPPGSSPWYTQEMLDEQRMLLGEMGYRRLFMNEWQVSGSGFVTLSEADRCTDPLLREISEPEPHVAGYVAALDYGEKEDPTAACLAHWCDGRMIVDRLDVVDPKFMPNGVVPVEWCDQWLQQIASRFATGQDAKGRERFLYVVADPYQLLWLIQKWEQKGHEHGSVIIEKFNFKSGTGNHELTLNLRSMILNKQIAWYPGCGTIFDMDGNPTSPPGIRNDLCTELGALKMRPLQGERVRLDHNPGGHDDRAFTVGVCAHSLAKQMIQIDPDWNFTNKLFAHLGGQEERLW